MRAHASLPNPQSTSDAPALHVDAVTFFGGVEIKHHD